ncbi:PQQ-binding-like beta-propeller repeat protein [Streptomyces sp. NBC_00829]|uniref:outer membrane protein assembly factor BamB family protein n=1 Tax=Streptomyces sp. NBC_00829 TaxID=2903679 RepID=UPI0038674596|nr:PQQ-like beta-propeller repeat protein [Streptomyces sp. NBC_00829]
MGVFALDGPGVVATGGYLSLSDQLVAAVGTGGKVVTFVASTGERKWTAPAQARYFLASDESSLYVVTTDGRLRPIGRSDATVRWTVRSPVDLLAGLGTRGVVAQGRLLCCVPGGDIVAVDTKNGSTLNEHSLTALPVL